MVFYVPIFSYLSLAPGVRTLRVPSGNDRVSRRNPFSSSLVGTRPSPTVVGVGVRPRSDRGVLSPYRGSSSGVTTGRTPVVYIRRKVDRTLTTTEKTEGSGLCANGPNEVPRPRTRLGVLSRKRRLDNPSTGPREFHGGKDTGGVETPECHSYTGHCPRPLLCGPISPPVRPEDQYYYYYRSDH